MLLRRIRLITMLLLALTAFAGASAQNPTPLEIGNFSQGAVALDGLWQFHLGDDPAWASPEFDDRGWEQLTADRPWGEQGHRAYAGFAWYRRRIRLAPEAQTAEAARGLALMVRHIADAYEIYWNGRILARNGAFPPHAVWYPMSQPAQTFAWPAGQGGVLAVRVWKAPLLSEDSGLRGGFTAPILAGTPDAIVAAKTELDYHWLRSQQFVFGEDLVYSLVALLSLLAWLRDRRQSVLLWMALFACASTARLMFFGLGIPWPRQWADGLASMLSSLRDVSLWFLLLTLLHLRQRRSLVWLTQLLAGINVVSIALDGLIIALGWTSSWFKTVEIADAVLTGVYIATVFWPLALVGFVFSRHVRQSPATRVVAVLAFFSGNLQVIQNVAPQGSRYTHWTLADTIAAPLFTVDGNAISIVPLTGLLLLGAIVWAIYLHSLEARQRQMGLEQELRSARELQRVIIPETALELPGYAITGAYLPAAEVGGDFFQLLPAEGAHSDSTLVVMGDVSGKGIKAAMSVALLVGVLRTLSESVSSPAALLAGLNRRLCGRMQGGLVTCLVVRVDADGECLLANAGHPPPFLNQREVESPGALPLGILSGIAYDESRFHIHPGDRLTLYTDGLLEARNPSGELFGFERLQRLMAQNPTASRAAQAAVDFGQDDDVTVLTLTRV